MVQKSLIASRSFQPGVTKLTHFVSGVRATRIRTTTYVQQSDTKILIFQKIIED